MDEIFLKPDKMNVNKKNRMTKATCESVDSSVMKSATLRRFQELNAVNWPAIYASNARL